MLFNSKGQKLGPSKTLRDTTIREAAALFFRGFENMSKKIAQNPDANEVMGIFAEILLSSVSAEAYLVLNNMAGKDYLKWKNDLTKDVEMRSDKAMDEIHKGIKKIIENNTKPK